MFRKTLKSLNYSFVIQFIQDTEQFKKEIAEIVNEKFIELRDTLQPPPEELMTREQTARYLNVDLSTLWHWSKKGKLMSYGIGNRVFYKRSEIMSALKPLSVKK